MNFIIVYLFKLIYPLCFCYVVFLYIMIMLLKLESTVILEHKYHEDYRRIFQIFAFSCIYFEKKNYFYFKYNLFKVLI